MTRPSNIVAVRITNWAYSAGGEHFTGTIKGFRHSISHPGTIEFHGIEVQHKLTAKEARLLNEKEQRRTNPYFTWKRGQLTDKFWTRDKCVAAAVEQFSKHFPDAQVLKEGDGSVASAQPILVGPEWFMNRVNAICADMEAFGGYDKQPKKWEQLFKEYRALVKKLGGD